MANFSASNEIAVLSACRSPLWTEQTVYTGAPSSSGSGISVAGAVTCGWKVVMRPRSGTGAGFPGRQVLVTVDTVDDTATYTLTLDGTAVNYAAGGGDDEQAILEGLAAAISGNVTTNALVTATATSIASVWTLTITGRAVDNYTFAVSTTGTGVLDCIADPYTASVRYWGYGVSGPGNNSAGSLGQSWEFVGVGATGFPITWGGLQDVLVVNFISRYYIEVFDMAASGDSTAGSNTLTYAVRVVLGPAQPE